jgi:cholesterol oxidase
MADSPERGVIDRENRVFNYQGLQVIDGSILAANLGVNPSLAITALAERAMSFVPARRCVLGSLCRAPRRVRGLPFDPG